MAKKTTEKMETSIITRRSGEQVLVRSVPSMAISFVSDNDPVADTTVIPNVSDSVHRDMVGLAKDHRIDFDTISNRIKVEKKLKKVVGLKDE